MTTRYLTPVDIDNEDLRELKQSAKRALRRRMRALRQALPPGAIAHRSQRIVERLTSLDEVQRAEHVGLFWPLEGRGEVDVCPLDGWLRSREKAVYYPFMDPTPEGFRTGFRATSGPGDLAQRGQPFHEPPRDAPEAALGQLDVVIVPALAAAPTGHRLGQGRGFYDVTLPEQCPPGRAVVVVYHFQLLAELPVEEHDVAAALVVTDETLWRV